MMRTLLVTHPPSEKQWYNLLLSELLKTLCRCNPARDTRPLRSAVHSTTCTQVPYLAYAEHHPLLCTLACEPSWSNQKGLSKFPRHEERIPQEQSLRSFCSCCFHLREQCAYAELRRCATADSIRPNPNTAERRTSARDGGRYPKLHASRWIRSEP